MGERLTTAADRQRYADGLNRVAGWSLKKAARSQKVLAIALGLSEGRISHVVHGDPTGAVQRFYQDVIRPLTQRMGDLKTNPGRIIGDVIVEAQDALSAFLLQDVRALYYQELAAETEAQAREDVSEQRVARLLGEWQAGHGSPALLRDLCDALDEHNEATADEMGRMINKLILGREIRRRVAEQAKEKS